MQFKGDLRIMTWEIGLSLLVAIGTANLVQTTQYRLLVFPLVFVVVLALLLFVTRKKGGATLD